MKKLLNIIFATFVVVSTISYTTLRAHASYTGNFWIPNYATPTISEVTQTGTITNYSSQGGYATAYDGSNIWETSSLGTFVLEISTSTGAVLQTCSGLGSGTTGIAYDNAGNMWVANVYGDSVSKVTSGCVVTNYATAGFSAFGIAFDGTNMWIVGQGSTIIKMSPSGTILSTYSTNITGAQLLEISFDGTNMWASDHANNQIVKITPTGATSTYAVGLNPRGVTFDGVNMWTANNGTTTLTKVSPTGSTTTCSGLSFSPGYVEFDGTNIWAVGGNTIAMVTPTCSITQYGTLGGNPQNFAFDGKTLYPPFSGSSPAKSKTQVIEISFNAKSERFIYI